MTVRKRQGVPRSEIQSWEPRLAPWFIYCPARLAIKTIFTLGRFADNSDRYLYPYIFLYGFGLFCWAWQKNDFTEAALIGVVLGPIMAFLTLPIIVFTLLVVQIVAVVIWSQCYLAAQVFKWSLPEIPVESYNSELGLPPEDDKFFDSKDRKINQLRNQNGMLKLALLVIGIDLLFDND